MVFANPPLAEPAADPGGVINKPPFEMGVANSFLSILHYIVYHSLKFKSSNFFAFR